MFTKYAPRCGIHGSLCPLLSACVWHVKAVSKVQFGCSIMSKVTAGAQRILNTAVTLLSLSETWGGRGSLPFNSNMYLEILLFCYYL